MQPKLLPEYKILKVINNNQEVKHKKNCRLSSLNGEAAEHLWPSILKWKKNADSLISIQEQWLTEGDFIHW